MLCDVKSDHLETAAWRRMSPLNFLLPRATAISDQHLQLLSHVVRIKSLSNGVGTGLLLQRNFVITAKQVVKTFLDPFEFTIQLGNAEAHGLDVVVHPSQDLAVIKIHPPIDNTGRIPISGSPKGFFWPIAHGDPKPGSLVKVYGYGGSFSYGSKNSLTFHSFKVAGPGANNIIFVRTESNVPTTSGDAGGPGLFNNGTLLGAVTGWGTLSPSPRGHAGPLSQAPERPQGGYLLRIPQQGGHPLGRPLVASPPGLLTLHAATHVVIGKA